MAITEAVQAMLDKKVPVLDHGFVVLVDVMGDDEAIVQAARVSYGKGTKSMTENRGLVRYLMRHRHTTPFEMVEMKFHVKLPIFVARQWIRHRTANVNEYSARYSIMEDEFYLPEADVIAEQSASNKQGRGETIDTTAAAEVRQAIEGHNKASYGLYEELMQGEDGADKGLAREIARITLPTNIYTQWYWKIDLHNLLHFLSLRMDPHAQYEIREYANKMGEMVKAAAPLAWEAFEDYSINVMRLTGPEITVLRQLLKSTEVSDDVFAETCKATGFANKREQGELRDKLERLLSGN
jgi:thymidylate synthase (FAD)